MKRGTRRIGAALGWACALALLGRENGAEALAGVDAVALQKRAAQEFRALPEGLANPANPITDAKVTGNPAERHFFEEPSLGKIEKTAPYFHDGSVATLSDAIRTMAAVQIGRDLEPGQVAQIQSFLGSLTGELPKGRIAKA